MAPVATGASPFTSLVSLSFHQPCQLCSYFQPHSSSACLLLNTSPFPFPAALRQYAPRTDSLSNSKLTDTPFAEELYIDPSFPHSKAHCSSLRSKQQEYPSAVSLVQAWIPKSTCLQMPSLSQAPKPVCLLSFFPAPSYYSEMEQKI